jgi:hypothetical protein
MGKLMMEALKPFVRERLEPFFVEVLRDYDNIDSIQVVGSAVTEDFVEGVSDINSVIVLKEMDLAFLDRLAPLGKKYRKKSISAPLIMTPEYIDRSLDVFALEFLNFRLIHCTVYGDDIFRDLEIERHDLRIQCEREIKSKLIWLRQSYISSMGESKLLLENITNSISGFIPLFRGIIFLMNEEPPLESHNIVKILGSISHFQTDIFEKVYNIKHKKYKPLKSEITGIFQEYYRASEKVGRVINDLQA